LNKYLHIASIAVNTVKTVYPDKRHSIHWAPLTGSGRRRSPWGGARCYAKGGKNCL